MGQQQGVYTQLFQSWHYSMSEHHYMVIMRNRNFIILFIDNFGQTGFASGWVRWSKRWGLRQLVDGRDSTDTAAVA